MPCQSHSVVDARVETGQRKRTWEFHQISRARRSPRKGSDFAPPLRLSRSWAVDVSAHEDAPDGIGAKHELGGKPKRKKRELLTTSVAGDMAFSVSAPKRRGSCSAIAVSSVDTRRPEP